MRNYNQPFSIDQKLQAMRPYIDLELFNRSIDYRRKVIFSFKEQERALQQLKDEFAEPSVREDYDCVLGYN
ncbi:hypothetical protein [Pseudoalteromonas spongiae]|uniref:hypothetical protein n=1 Tax=Pseudoalteromonas spongiae TaxID=298657 RepID=UPI000C2D13E6|nr:hypothetical protein [Pseudoalteromonas spongiae]